MSLPKHTISPAHGAPATKRAKQPTVDIDIPSQLKGTSFKFKARPNQDGGFQAWLFDVIVTAFPTAKGEKDEIIMDVQVKHKKKKKFDSAKFMAAFMEGGEALDNLYEDDEDEDEDDISRSHHEDDDYDEFDEEEEEDDISDAMGSVFARIVHRHKIRSTFWRDMEEPSQDTCKYLFDQNVWKRGQAVHHNQYASFASPLRQSSQYIRSESVDQNVSYSILKQ